MYDTNTKDIEQAQNGSKTAMEKIIENNSGLIWSIVKRFCGRGYSKEELYQIGAIGFIKAIKRFDFSFKVQFSTYAVPYIMGEIKRFIRDDGPIKISRSIKELGAKISELQREQMNKTGRELSINEIAEKLNVLKEEIAQAIEAVRPLESVDDDVYKQESDGESKISRISNKSDETNQLINKLAINKLIEELDVRSKRIIVLRYFREKTQTEVAKMLGISQVQVSRIEKKVLISMREKMNC